MAGLLAQGLQAGSTLTMPVGDSPGLGLTLCLSGVGRGAASVRPCPVFRTAQYGPYSGCQFCWQERLEDPVVSSRFESRQDCLAVFIMAALRHDHHHGHLRACPYEAAQGVLAFARHHEIENYQVRVQGFKQPQGRFAIGRAEDTVPARLQSILDVLKLVGICVSHQDQRFRGFRSRHSGHQPTLGINRRANYKDSTKVSQ